MLNIYDIAERSGFSIATVSRVLNRSPNVSQKTRDKILAVMREEDYTPNAFARGLGLNTMRMIGILCTDISDTYYAKAVSLVENCLRKKGFDALLCCTGNSLEEKKKYLNLLLAKRVDAVILIGSAFKENTDNSHIEAAAQQTPVMIINGLVELPNTYCVLCDEGAAAYDNISLLCSGGCTRILYLYDVLTYSGCVKIEGYKRALEKCGVPFDPALIVQVPKSIEGARGAVEGLFSRGVEFDAVMASEDLLAAGALKALTARGCRMPVIGFNNSVIAEASTPALTSVDNRLETLCPTAVDMLTSLLSGTEIPRKVVIPARLVERETLRVANLS